VRQLSPEQLDALRRVLIDDDTPNRVRVAMALIGATQAEVVAFTGFAQPYVSDVVRGRFRSITVENAQKFADFFGCAIEDLFVRADERRTQRGLPFRATA
jgi:transcriptional regulator with XRE-family HTH domain